MSIFIFFITVLWVSFCFAKVEIAIEGKDGWAGKLPTWKLSPNHILSKLFFGGRPMTGYHVWISVFIFSIIHLVYLFLPWNYKLELRLISFFIFFWMFEDFLWFVFNPAFGLKNFRKDKIWWHAKHWWLFAPRDYFILIPLAIILFWLSF